VRVLFISDVYFPRVNGVSTSIHTFRQDLASCAVETLLVAPRYEPELAEEHGILRVPATRVPGDPEDRRMSWRALMRTLDALPHGAFDLVHIHTPFIAHYAGVRCARRAGVACVATYHTFFEEYLHHYLPVMPRAVGRLLARSFTRSQCAAVQALIAPSEPMRAVLEAYGVLLVIAGEGPARAALRAEVAARGLTAHVHFAGYLERGSALLDCYAAASVFVFASRTETQGLVLLEAMAQGVPVVSTAELGTRSVLPGSGALIVAEERHAFAAAVVRVLGDAQLRAEMAMRGRAHARTWSSAAMARKLAGIYAALHAAPRVAGSSTVSQNSRRASS